MKKVKYPDGQISVILDEVVTDNFTIKERINSYEDLLYVRSIADAVHSTGHVPTIVIPCLFGQRSDRRFNGQQSHDLKLIAEVINNCRAKQVMIFDPHSQSSLDLIENSTSLSSYKFVQEAYYHMSSANKVLVAPDAGAYKKVYDYAEVLATPLVAAVKHRTKEGKPLVEVFGDVKGKDCLIVDDYADGGRTFIKLGEKLKEQGASKVNLYVSHGLFSAGFEDLKKVIDHIYCTNSISDLKEDAYITQFKHF